jgi:hypothetical protein
MWGVVVGEYAGPCTLADESPKTFVLLKRGCAQVAVRKRTAEINFSSLPASQIQ